MVSSVKKNSWQWWVVWMEADFAITAREVQSFYDIILPFERCIADNCFELPKNDAGICKFGTPNSADMTHEKLLNPFGDPNLGSLD